MPMKRLLPAIALSLCLLALAPLVLSIAAPPAATAAPSKAAPAARAPAAKPAPAAPAPAAAPSADAASADLTRVADEVAKDVEALRGWKFKQPVARQLVTREQTMAWLEKEIAAQASPELLATKQAFLRTVGLLPPDCDLKKTFLSLMEGQVAGYYDSGAKVLCIVQRDGVKPAGLVERIMLAHELGHALDDQYIDLDKLIRQHGNQSEDGDLVISSLMEGSATVMMMRYVPRLQLTGQFDLTELLQYNKAEEASTAAFLEAPPYFSSMLGAYMCGMNFLARGNFLALMLSDKDVGDQLLAAAKDPPRSTEQILHPEKYWDAAARDEPVVASDDDARKMLAQGGRWVVHTDTLGEMLCAILTTPKDAKADPMMMVSPAYWTNTVASGWGGDRFYLLASGPSAAEAGKSLKDLRGVWLTFWDTPQDRDEFFEACESNPVPGRAAAKVGSLGAVFFYGLAEPERQAIRAKLEKSPPKMTRDSKPWSPWAM